MLTVSPVLPKRYLTYSPVGGSQSAAGISALQPQDTDATQSTYRPMGPQILVRAMVSSGHGTQKIGQMATHGIAQLADAHTGYRVYTGNVMTCGLLALHPESAGAAGLMNALRSYPLIAHRTAAAWRLQSPEVMIR